MRTLAIFAVVTVAGCASGHRNSGPQSVQMTKNRDAVRGCTSLGVIDSDDHTNGGAATQTVVDRDRYRRLQNEAARLGANIVLMTGGPSGINDTRLLYGEAYRCAGL
jgi:hypothetical protein